MMTLCFPFYNANPPFGSPLYSLGEKLHYPKCGQKFSDESQSIQL